MFLSIPTFSYTKWLRDISLIFPLEPLLSSAAYNQKLPLDSFLSTNIISNKRFVFPESWSFRFKNYFIFLYQVSL